MSELVRATDVTLTLGAQVVLRGVSFALSSGEKVGLVGRNGAGKTTLLSLVAGLNVPTDGQIVRAPGLRLGVLEQITSWRGTLWEVASGGLAYVQGLEAALRDAETRLDSEAQLQAYAELTTLFEGAGGYEAETTLRTYLSRLGFSDADDDRDVSTLSGGERARLGLARVLAERPDLLLLDEPSSFLDLPTKGWLVETLARLPGTLLLASHDRALLDAVCGRTFELKDGVVTSYRGPYSRYRAQASHAVARALRQADRVAHEKRTLEAQIRTQPTLSTRRSLERRLSRLPDVSRTTTTKKTSLMLTAAPVKPNSLLLEVRHLSLTRGEQPLLKDAFLRVYAGDKVAVVGPNGSGKTSLLGVLEGALESDHPEASVQLSRNVKVAVFDQHSRGLEDGASVGEQLSRNVSEPRARSLLALVGLAEAFDREPETLSGGERARAGVALLLASEANLLLLDEPSEQLDIETVEKLQTALQDTDAAVILVSHDAALIDAVATRVLGLDGGELKEYRGGLAGYYAGTLRLEPDLPETSDPDEPEFKPDPEAELTALEDETATTEELLADPLRLTERDRGRLERRLRDLIDLRSERYDARLPPPEPRYRAVDAGVVLTTNGDGRPVVFDSSAGRVLLHLDAATHIGHLLVQGAQDRCTLPWAERALLRGAARLAFEVLGARALQFQRGELDEPGFERTGFESAGNGWWVQDRDCYARREGLLRPERKPRPRKVRRLRYPKWESWTARRGRRKTRSKR